MSQLSLFFKSLAATLSTTRQLAIQVVPVRQKKGHESPAKDPRGQLILPALRRPHPHNGKPRFSRKKAAIFVGLAIHRLVSRLLARENVGPTISSAQGQ